MRGKLLALLLALGVALGLCLSSAVAWAEDGEVPAESELASTDQEGQEAEEAEHADEEGELTAQAVTEVGIIEYVFDEPRAGAVAPSAISVSTNPPVAANESWVPVQWAVVRFINGAGAVVGNLDEGASFEAGYGYIAMAQAPTLMSMYAYDEDAYVFYNGREVGSISIADDGTVTVPPSQGFGPLVENPTTLVRSFDLAVDEPAVGDAPDLSAAVTFTCGNGSTVAGTSELALTWREYDSPSYDSDSREMGEGDTFQEGKYYLVQTVREDGAFSVLPDGCYYNLMDSESFEWSVNGRLRSAEDATTNYFGPLSEEGPVYPYTLTYVFDDETQTATVTGLTTDSTVEGDLVIPETVRNEGTTYTVTTIGKNAFRNRNAFKGMLSLPDTITSILEGAFYNCYGFTGSLRLPASLKSIGKEAFWGCYGFTGSWSFPDGLETLGNNAFIDCYRIGGTIALPASVTSIGDYCFYMSNGHGPGWQGVGGLTFAEDSQLERIGSHAFDGNWYFKGGLDLPASLVEIGSYAFTSTFVSNYGDYVEGELKLPEGIKTIGEGAFNGCSFSGDLVIPVSLTADDESIGKGAFEDAGFNGTLTLPEGLTTVPETCFYQCDFTGTLNLPSTLTKVGTHSFATLRNMEGSLVIPESLTKIEGQGAFSNFGGTGALVLPDTVTEIGYSAFSGGDFTGALIIPDSVESIGGNAFWDCDGFTSLKLPDNPNFTTIERSTFSAWSPYSGDRMGFVGTLDIPDSVTSIGEEAFAGCSKLTGTLSLPEGVTSIGAEAFEYCTGFTALDLPTSLTSIGSEAFQMCTGLTGDLVIPANVTSIGNEAFSGCKGFDGTLTLPSGLTTIGQSAFNNCGNLTGVASIPDSVTTLGNGAFSGCVKLSGYRLPDGIRSIPPALFDDCSGMTGTLTIPETVTSIGSSAFDDCSGFTGSLSIPSTVTSIGTYAFSGCSGLTGALVLPNGLTKIESNAFSGCSGFTGALTLPSQLTQIDYNAFKGCSGLTGSLMLPDSLTNIGSNAFEDCSGFTGTLVIPSGVTTLSSSAFSGCSGFTGLEMHQQDSSLSSSLFADCTGLTGDITIPSTVTRIYYGVFSGCTGLDGTLTIPATVTRYGNASALYGSHFSTIVNESNQSFNGGISADNSYYYVDSTGARADTIATGTYRRMGGPAPADSRLIADATVTVASQAYTGAALTPAPTVKVGTTTLQAGTDYTVAYKNNVDAGTATMTITGKGNYTGTKDATFTIAQATNTASVAKKSVKKTVKLAAAKKKAQKVALPKVTAKFGTAAWKVTSKDKKKVLSLKSGKVVVKKGAKKGTYTLKLKATVPASKNYGTASTKVVTVKVVVK